MSAGGTTQTLSTQSSITINAPAEKVWKALTTPEQIKQWFFGVETETSWRVGSPVIHRGEWQGKPYEDKGQILRFEPYKVLAHSHWSSLSGKPDQPENYQNVTYNLSEHDGKTELTVTEHNLPSEEGKATSAQSWQTVLNVLKAYVEQH